MKTKIKPKSRTGQLSPAPTQTLPVLAGKRRISKLNTEGMRSILGDNVEQMQQLLEASENDSAITLIHRRMLQSLLDLLPYAEHAIRKSKGARGVYQINSLVSSVRELIIDIQSTQDRGQIGANLIEKVVRPVFMDLAMEVVKEYDQLRAGAKDLMSAEDFKLYRNQITDSRKRVADFLQDRFVKMREDSISFLQK